MSASRKPGLGSFSSRTREEERDRASRITSEAAPVPPPQPVASVPPSLSVAGPQGYGQDEDGAPDGDEATFGAGSDEGARHEAPDESVDDEVRERRVSSRGRPRGRRADESATDTAMPPSLTPSRVSEKKLQIGPRLKPAVYDRFSNYLAGLVNTGVTQSDVVESALIEYMDRYPAAQLRTALLGKR